MGIYSTMGIYSDTVAHHGDLANPSSRPHVGKMGVFANHSTRTYPVVYRSFLFCALFIFGGGYQKATPANYSRPLLMKQRDGVYHWWGHHHYAFGSPTLE